MFEDLDKALTEDILETIDGILPELIRARDKLNLAIVEMEFFRSKRTINNDRSIARIVMRGVLDHFGLTAIELQGKSRESEVTMARHIFMSMTKSKTNLSYNSVGKLVNRNHATAIHAAKLVKEAPDYNHLLWEHYQMIEERVNRALIIGVIETRRTRPRPRPEPENEL